MNARQLPDGSSREVAVGAAGGGAGARVVQHGDERVGRVADHRLQVKAMLGEGWYGQRPLPAGPRRQPWARETRACRMEEEEEIRARMTAKWLLWMWKVKMPFKSVNVPLSAPSVHVFWRRASAKFLQISYRFIESICWCAHAFFPVWLHPNSNLI